MNIFSTLKTELKMLLTENIESVFEKFRNVIPTESTLFDDFVMTLSRYKDLNRSQHNGLLSPIEYNIELNKIRGSILNIINNLESLESGNVVIQTTPSQTKNNDEEVETEEFGLFDIEEMMHDSMKGLEQTLKRLTIHTTELGSKTKEDTAKILKYKKSNPNPNNQILKRLYDNAAANLNDYGEGLNIEIPIFERYTKNSTSYALTYIAKIYEIGIELNVKEIDDFYKAIKDLLNNAKDSKYKLDGLHESVKKLPDLTSELIKAKNKVLKLLNAFFEYYDNYLNDLDKLINSIENTLLEMA